jgi:hypothetical protein
MNLGVFRFYEDLKRRLLVKTVPEDGQLKLCLKTKRICARRRSIVTPKRLTCLVILVYRILSGCTPAAPTGTGALPPTATTPSQRWTSGPVLIAFATRSESTAPFGVSRVPDLILYADGQLIVRSEGEILTTRIPHEEVCHLLTTIESTGFFDVEMDAYHTQVDAQGLGITAVTRIEVNAWRHHSVAADALQSLIDDPDVEVPPALRETYRLLSDYHPSDMKPYRATPIALAIHRCPQGDPCETERMWPLKSPTLSTIFERAETTGVENREWGMGVLLDGEEATALLRAVGPTMSGTFVEDEVTYHLSARPALPYESLESAMAYQAEIPSPGVGVDRVKLECVESP